MLKVRREGKDQKKNFSLKQQAPFAKPLPSLVKPAMEAGQDNPEWLISEDWALLQVPALAASSAILAVITRNQLCCWNSVDLFAGCLLVDELSYSSNIFTASMSLLCLWQAVKQLLELPLNLTIVSPAHTPNWDLVSDVVNSCSRIYRSPKQCRSRYENVIIPREEGKVVNLESQGS